MPASRDYPAFALFKEIILRAEDRRKKSPEAQVNNGLSKDEDIQTAEADEAVRGPFCIEQAFKGEVRKEKAR